MFLIELRHSSGVKRLPQTWVAANGWHEGARAVGAGRSRSWPSTKPGRRLGPGLFPGRHRTEPGMQLHYRAGYLGCRPRVCDRSPSH